MPILPVCPACRGDDAVALSSRPERGLSCPRCGASYPVTVAPIVASPLAPFVKAIAGFHHDLAALSALSPWLPDDDDGARALARVSVAARAQFGDRFGTSASVRAFDPMVSAFSSALPPGARVVELGCGAGRVALELATAGRSVAALDSDPSVLSIGVSVRDAGGARVPVRRVGATYDLASWSDDPLKGRDVTFLLADALSPPLDAGVFDGAVALNVLDNVRVPTTLLGQLHALLKPGGSLLLATPFAWDSAHTDDGERIGGARGRPFGGDPEEELRRVLDGRALGAPWRFEVVEAWPHVPWTLVRDDRLSFTYDVFVARLRSASP